MKPSISDSAYSALPLLSRRALCTHYYAASNRLRGIEESFIKSVRKRIESAHDDNDRAEAFWECFDDMLPALSQLSEETLKSYREILVAHVEGSPELGEEDVKKLIAALETTGAEIIEDTISRVPRWLKVASDGELFTQEDIRFIDERRREWSVHHPGKAEDFQNSFEIDCELCGCRVRKLAHHLGGAEFDIPAAGEGNWIRHGCYGDISRIMRELLNRWVVPTWFIQPEFVGSTVQMPYSRVDSVTGKVEELELLKIPVAEKVTREVRSDMERDIREILQAVAERENELFIHQSALALAKRISLSPLLPIGTGHIQVPLRGQPSRNRIPEPETLWEYLKQDDMAITDRTYFVIEAEALNHSQDRPNRLVAAYSTKDPYLGDLALVCFAESSMDLLKKLQTLKADHQKLLVHWGESKEELEQLPDVLRAYLSLKETAKAVPGKHFNDALKNLRSFFVSEKKKRGRPRQDALSKRVEELKRSGQSWGKIQKLLNKETGVERTLGAYRNLLRSRLKPDRA